jgi:hypothetical protein
MTSQAKPSSQEFQANRSRRLPAQTIYQKCEQVIDQQARKQIFKATHDKVHTLLDLHDAPLSKGKHSTKPNRRRPRKPGWPSTTGLLWSEVKEIYEINNATERLGIPLNAFVSINPDDTFISDSIRKRACYKLESNFLSRLRRKGVPFLALRVFEKKIDGSLHMHLLIHLPRFLINEAIQWSNSNIDIRKSGKHHIGYITKQRHPQHPNFERLVKHTRQKSASFCGKRWSISKALAEELNSKE